MEREQPAVRADHSPTRCPYCKDGLEDPTKLVACAACGARHHSGCFGEHGRCSTCGGTEQLVPARALRKGREEPPAGSRIQVERSGDAVVYTYPATTLQALALAGVLILTVVASPLGFWLLYRFLTDGPRRIRIEGDTIELDVMKAMGIRAKTIRVRREEIAGLRIVDVQGWPHIAVDLGLERYHVVLGLMGAIPALAPAEIEWLAGALETWKNDV